MTTYYSKPIWGAFAPLAYLQFPWRFLTFTAFFSAILSGAFVNLLKVPILKLSAAFALVLLLILPNLKLFKPQTYRTDLDDRKATSDEVINWQVSGSSFEYIPKGAQLIKGPLGTNLVEIDKSQIPSRKFAIEKGSAQISGLASKPNRVKFEISAANESKVRANIFNFPGWRVKVDNKIVKIDDNNRLKLVTFDVPAGEHKVDISFNETQTRIAANMISLISIISIIFLLKKWQTKLN